MFKMLKKLYFIILSLLLMPIFPAMAATAIANLNKSSSQGAVRDMWVKFTKADGGLLANGTAATTMLYTCLNPFNYDVAIVEALLNITTEDDDDIDMDIGLGNDSAGAGASNEVCDSAINTAVAVTRLTNAGDSTDGTVTAPIWKAAPSGTDTYMCFYQTGASTHGVLKFTLLLRVIPVADLS